MLDKKFSSLVTIRPLLPERVYHAPKNHTAWNASTTKCYTWQEAWILEHGWKVLLDGDNLRHSTHWQTLHPQLWVTQWGSRQQAAGRQPGLVGSCFGKLQQKSVPGNAHQFSSTEQLRHTTPMWMAPSDIIKPQEFKIWMDCSSFCPSKRLCMQTTSEHKCKLPVSWLYLNWCCALPDTINGAPAPTHLAQAALPVFKATQGHPALPDPGPYQWHQSSCLLPAADPHGYFPECHWGLLSLSHWSDWAPHAPALLFFIIFFYLSLSEHHCLLLSTSSTKLLASLLQEAPHRSLLFSFSVPSLFPHIQLERLQVSN